MFTKVIIGDDARAGGRDAIALARALAPDAELVLAGTYPYDLTASRFALQGYANALRDDTNDALRKARDAGRIPAARIAAIADTSPARGLRRLAAEEDADLVVIGSAHHGTPGRLLLGDVARAVLHGSPCPVAVAPQGFAGRPPKTIGVAFNGAPEACAALEVAAALAAACAARLVVRDVLETHAMPAYGPYPAYETEEHLDAAVLRARSALDSAVADATTTPTTDVEVDAEVVTGQPAELLDELAAQVDLMVCGSRGWGAVRRVALGSTSDRLIHHAPCPVLVTPRTSHATEATTVPVEATAPA
jgi:nucleotide-binding universal stress UspA family protein